MQFQVIDIEFDFDEDDDFPEHQFSNITDENIGMIWEADDEEDLVDEITAATGFCIKSIDYRHILSSWWHHFVMAIPGLSLMPTIMKIVSTMIIWQQKIMIEKNTIEMDGMPNDMILNDGEMLTVASKVSQ